MWHALRKAAELARADRAALPFNFDLDPAFENDEAFIALFVEVESGVLPALVGVVESDLEPVGLKADFVRGLTAWEQGGVVGEPLVVEPAHARTS